MRCPPTRQAAARLELTWPVALPRPRFRHGTIVGAAIIHLEVLIHSGPAEPPCYVLLEQRWLQVVMWLSKATSYSCATHVEV
jgi:hypothetical protein